MVIENEKNNCKMVLGWKYCCIPTHTNWEVVCCIWLGYWLLLAEKFAGSNDLAEFVHLDVVCVVWLSLGREVLAIDFLIHYILRLRDPFYFFGFAHFCFLWFKISDFTLYVFEEIHFNPFFSCLRLKYGFLSKDRGRNWEFLNIKEWNEKM